MSTVDAPFAKLYAGVRPHLPALQQDYAGLIYIALLTRRGQDGRCDPSVATIANDIGISRHKTIRAGLRRLEVAGVIERAQRPGNSDLYSFPPLDIRTFQPRAQSDPGQKAPGAKTDPGRITPGAVSASTPGAYRPDTPGAKRPPKKNPQKEEGKKRAANAASSATASLAASPLAASGGGASPSLVVGAVTTQLPAQDLFNTTDSSSSGSTTVTTSGVPASETGVGTVPASKAGEESSSRRQRRKTVPTATSESGVDPVDDRAAIRSNSMQLAAWFGYGRPGLGVPLEQWPAMKPSATNWFHHAFDTVEQLGDAADAIAPDATPIQVAAYAWWCLNRIRESKGLSLMLPESHDLLGKNGRGGFLGELIKTRGPLGVAKLVQIVRDNFDEIDKAVSWRGSPLVPDRDLFTDKGVQKAADAVALNESRNSEPELIIYS